MILNEDLFDDVVVMEIPSAEISDVVPEQVAEMPAVGEPLGVSNEINALIRDEWEAIEGYNNILPNLNNYPDIANVIKHIAEEENKHVGELQAALKTLSPNAEAIEAGNVEATSEMNESVDELLNEAKSMSAHKRAQRIADDLQTFINDLSNIPDTVSYADFFTPQDIRDLETSCDMLNEFARWYATVKYGVEEEVEGIATEPVLNEADEIDSESFLSKYTEAFDQYKDWDPADVELHKSIDWAARNYEEYPVDDDTFEGEINKYDLSDGEHETVKMRKYLRSNPIYPPYYAPVEKQYQGSKTVGPMYDGHKRGRYDIHDRYESQELYDMMFN